MTLAELASMVSEIGIPFAYDHFAEGEGPDPPFICFLTPESENFAADGKVYFKINSVRLEMYADHKDPGMERRVEEVLDRNEIFYDKTEVWIESEKLYEVVFSFEMEGDNNAE